MSRIVLVSNRVMDIGQAAQAGGVAVAIADILSEHGGLWFGWNGQITEEAADAPLEIAEHGRATIATISLDEAEHERYYLGYANSVLWPVFHNRLDLAKFKAGFFEGYGAVNRRIAALRQLPGYRERRDIASADRLGKTR